MHISFHGAAQTVTGSQHLLTINGRQILLDCGFYQGKREETWQRNRHFPFRPADIDAVVLSHAHIDHSGNIPNLVKQGFRGKIVCTPATADLCGALLTHRHSDHAGNATFLQTQFGIRICAHWADAAVLEGFAPRARLRRGEGSLVAGLFAWLENLWPARVRIDQALSGGEVVAGFEVHWVPGHTEGSVFYRHASTLSLATGDTLLTAHPPLVLRRGLALPYPSFTLNMKQALESLRAFHRGDFPYEHLLPGHGPPLSGGARDRVLRFLEAEPAFRP